MGIPLLAARKLAPLLIALAIGGASGCRDRQPKTAATPPTTRTASLSPEVAEDLDRVVEDAVKRGDVPGAVLVVGHSGGIVYQKAYGNRAVAPMPEPMTLDTVFDLASLTKPLATATSVLILADRGKIDLKAPVSRYLSGYAAGSKEDVTVEQLMLHVSGAIPDNAMTDYAGGAVSAIGKVLALKPTTQPGARFVYSDMNYVVLGELVKAVDGRSLDKFAAEEIYGPLRMTDASFLPDEPHKARAAPTEQRNGHWMRGEVHDPRSYALGGVAGHAGLFGTGSDVARFCRTVLGGGEIDGKRTLPEGVVRRMTTPIPLPHGDVRSLAFDCDTGYAVAPRGGRFARGSTFGHTGFTGTMFWLDPKNDAFVVLLTNSVHPDGKGNVRRLRYTASTLAAEGLLGAYPRQSVRNGIDVAKRDGFAALKGRRVGVVTNHTGLDHDGNRLIDLLAAAPDVKLVKIFSPEHGLQGVLDEKVGNSTDTKTGLPVVSLYGDNRRPTDAMLEGIDTLVFDIQDIGARFYTYISTLGLCMEEAAKHKIRFVVLDRPNPNGGVLTDGPIAEPKYFGFICYNALPVVHGMTIGELARYFNAEYKINCELQVISLQGWDRRTSFEATDLTWVNPSPNIRNPTEALVYLSVGLLEMSNVSVGRGTDAPFEQFGAPWVDGKVLADALNARRLPGLRFSPTSFTPTSSKFKDQACQGVRITVTNRSAVDPVRSGLVMAWVLRDRFGEKFEMPLVAKMLHNDVAMKTLTEAKDPDTVPAVWQADLSKFRAAREKYLLYP
jgi:uncharacterized protein YbbC (DUF1343 family)